VISSGLPEEEYYWQVEVSQSSDGTAIGFKTLRIPRCWGLRALIRVKELVGAGANDINIRELVDGGYIDMASATDPNQQPPSFVEQQRATRARIQ
jgi:hypothetical protein